VLYTIYYVLFTIYYVLHYALYYAPLGSPWSPRCLSSSIFKFHPGSRWLGGRIGQTFRSPMSPLCLPCNIDRPGRGALGRLSPNRVGLGLTVGGNYREPRVFKDTLLSWGTVSVHVPWHHIPNRWGQLIRQRRSGSSCHDLGVRRRRLYDLWLFLDLVGGEVGTLRSTYLVVSLA